MKAGLSIVAGCIVAFIIGAPVLTHQSVKVIPEIALLGVHLGNAEDAMAIAEDLHTGKQEVFSIGSSVFGFGKLVAIRPKFLILQGSNEQSIVRLKKGWTDDAQQEISEEAMNESVAAQAEVPTTVQVNEALDGRVEVLLDTDKVKSRWHELPAMLQQAGLEPVMQNGAQVGWRLGTVTPGSLLADIGLSSNDVIRSMNGELFASTSRALEILNSEKTQRDRLQLVIERNGQEQSLSVRYSH